MVSLRSDCLQAAATSIGYADAEIFDFVAKGLLHMTQGNVAHNAEEASATTEPTEDPWLLQIKGALDDGHKQARLAVQI